jgi:hypothetical protein
MQWKPALAVLAAPLLVLTAQNPQRVGLSASTRRLRDTFPTERGAFAVPLQNKVTWIELSN